MDPSSTELVGSESTGGYFADMDGVHEMLKWIQSRICVAGYAKNMWDDASHRQIVIDFIYQPSTTRLLAWVPKTAMNRLVLSTDGGGETIPRPSDAYEFQYFVRGPSATLTPATIQDAVVFGVCSPEGMGTLLRVMSNIFVPHVSGDTSLPEGVRRSYTDHLHKFMCNLTETVNQCKGKTVVKSQVLNYYNYITAIYTLTNFKFSDDL